MQTTDSAAESVSNGKSPRLKRSPANLKLVGQALFGSKAWLALMGCELQVDEMTLRRWVSGKAPVPPAVWEALGKACQTRGKALLEFSERISAPSDDGRPFADANVNLPPWRNHPDRFTSIGEV